MFNAFTEEARNLLALCAAVEEPILITDVLAMAPDLFSGPVAVLDAARQAEERIYGDGEILGYTLSDPELQAVWMTELQSSDQWAGWQMRFLDYGARILEGLRTKAIAPRQAPACVVYGYGRALEAINAPLEVRARLLCRAWADAWEWLGWPQGFQVEVMRIFDSAAKDPANLGIMVLAGLCYTAVGHWAAIPEKFLREVLKRELISPAQALSLVDLANGQKNLRNVTLATIYPLLPPDFVRQVEEEVPSSTILIYGRLRPETGDSVDVLSEEEAEQQLRHLENVVELRNSFDTYEPVTELVNRLPENLIERGLDLWVAATDYLWSFPSDVIFRLPDQLVERVYRMGIDMMVDVDYDRAIDEGIDVLNRLLPRLSDQQVMHLVEMRRYTCIANYSIETRVEGLPLSVLRRLLNMLEQDQKKVEYVLIIEELKQVIEQRGKESVAIEESATPEKFLSDEQLVVKLAEVRKKNDPGDRVAELAWLAGKSSGGGREKLVEEALGVLMEIYDEEKAVRGILRLGPLLNAKQADALLNVARRVPLDHNKRGYAAWSRSQAVLALAGAYPEARRLEIQAEAVQWALEEADSSCREKVFGAIVGRLPAGLRYGALQGIWELYSDEREYKGWHMLRETLPDFGKVWFAMCEQNNVDPYATLVKTLRMLMHGPMWIVSAGLDAFHTVIYALGGEKVIVEAIFADIDTRSWQQ